MKQTPFSLFIRQALQNFTGNSFIPQESDVKSGVQYASGQKTGSYAGGGGDPIWQYDQNQNLDWSSAQIYAQYLDADGATVDETPQNIWRLPTIGELMKAKTDGFISSDGGGGFLSNSYHWSASEDIHNAGQAWFVFAYPSVLNLYSDSEEISFHVRCVKI